MSVSSVKIYLNMALEYLDSPYRVDDVEPNLLQAEQRLSNLSPSDAAPLVAQIAEIRAKLDNIVKPADARQISAAQGKVRQARDFISTNNGNLNQSAKDHVEELFRGAVQYLDQITDARKADRLKVPVLAEIAQIRAQYGTNVSATPSFPVAKPATPPPPSQNFYNAKRAVFWANSYFETPGRTDQVEPELAKADALLKDDNSAEAAALVAEMAELREKLAEMVSSADTGRVSAAQGKIRQARNYIERNGGRVSESDKEFIETLCRGAVEYLDQITHPRKADELKAPVLAEIAQLRAQYHTNVPAAAAAPPPPPKPATPPPPSQNFYNAKRAVFWANSYFETPGRIDQVEPELAKADGLLNGETSREADALRVEIAGLRAKLAEMVSSADTGRVSAAQGKIHQVRNYIERNGGRVSESDKEFIETLCRGAVEYLDQITHPRKADELKAPVLAEIARIRSQYGINVAAPAAPPPPPKPSTPPPPSANFSNAKRKVFWANSYFTSPRIEQTEPELAQADELLKGDTSREADALRVEIAELREKLADTVMPDDERHVSSAQRRVVSINELMARSRDSLNKTDQKEHIDLLCRQIIEENLDKIKNKRKGDQLKAPVLAEIARIRQQLNLTSIAPTSQPPPPSQTQTQTQARSPSYSSPPPPPPDMNSLSFEDQDRLNRARRTVGQARSNIESRRTEGVESLFFDATSLVATVADAHKASLLAEIEQLRVDLEVTRLAEATRNLTGELDRKLKGIEMDVEYPDRFPYSVRSFNTRFEQEDVRRTLTPEMYRDYEARLENTLTAAAAHVKNDKLRRAAPHLQKLHNTLATNPFTGLEQYDANRVDGDLRSMRWQVEKEIKQLPEDDADRLRIYDELKATDAKFEAYSDEWAKAGLHVEIKRGWEIICDDVKDWEQESLDPDAQPLEDPKFPQTRLAIRRVHYYLHDDTSVQRTRDENPGDSVIAAIDAEAEHLLEAAGRKMSSAFDHIMDIAERMPTPISDRWVRDKPGYLVTSANGTFEGTKFHDPVVARIRALDERWKAELAGVIEGRENLGEKLSLEATQKWPSIVAAIPTVSGFDPSSAVPGDAVHLEGVYNRSGWDFDGNQYGFSMRYNGVPLGGLYEPHVTKALDHAAYELKLDIDDHKEWDVIGVVLGPGKIKERTKRTIRRGMETETIEEWLPIDCLRLRIIALRAGPVVVGPLN